MKQDPSPNVQERERVGKFENALVDAPDAHKKKQTGGFRPSCEGQGYLVPHKTADCNRPTVAVSLLLR